MFPVLQNLYLLSHVRTLGVQMDSEHQFIIEPANDWEMYSASWSAAMQHLYWYKEDPVFDFNRHEEIDEMRSDFGNPGSLFLVARIPDHEEIVGVLGLRYRGIMARIRRWEPAVLPKVQRTGVSTALLEQALRYLTSMGVKRIGCSVKYPESSPEVVETHLRLYEMAGFDRERPDSIDMVKSLENIESSSKLRGVQVETGENFTFEDLASITVKSFTSTPEEREIHGFDKTVTEHIQATALLQRMAEGYYGDSPDDFRKIAVVDGVPAGFLGGFVSASKYKPLTGILGPMAVLPDYRRKRIGLHLINELLRTMKEYGCEYAVVGTPAANYGAIELYKVAGFRLACRLISLARDL
jgi:GNAT superfamily N-acetyltransferase